jgi:hypothetical protein
MVCRSKASLPAAGGEMTEKDFMATDQFPGGVTPAVGTGASTTHKEGGEPWLCRSLGGESQMSCELRRRCNKPTSFATPGAARECYLAAAGHVTSSFLAAMETSMPCPPSAHLQSLPRIN